MWPEVNDFPFCPIKWGAIWKKVNYMCRKKKNWHKTWKYNKSKIFTIFFILLNQMTLIFGLRIVNSWKGPLSDARKEMFQIYMFFMYTFQIVNAWKFHFQNSTQKRSTFKIVDLQKRSTFRIVHKKGPLSELLS